MESCVASEDVSIHRLTQSVRSAALSSNFEANGIAFESRHNRAVLRITLSNLISVSKSSRSPRPSSNSKVEVKRTTVLLMIPVEI